MFYGPFREAAESTPQFGDRRSYQMDPANAREAMREIELDLEEGADMIMVKPAMPYLDIIRQARDRFHAPLGAYQVSGEFSMIMAAMKNWLDRDTGHDGFLTAIRRAAPTSSLRISFEGRGAVARLLCRTKNPPLSSSAASASSTPAHSPPIVDPSADRPARSDTAPDSRCIHFHASVIDVANPPR